MQADLDAQRGEIAGAIRAARIGTIRHYGRIREVLERVYAALHSPTCAADLAALAEDVRSVLRDVRRG